MIIYFFLLHVHKMILKLINNTPVMFFRSFKFQSAKPALSARYARRNSNQVDRVPQSISEKNGHLLISGTELPERNKREPERRSTTPIISTRWVSSR